MWLPGAGGEGKQELFHRFRVSVGEGEKVLGMDGSDSYATI